MNLHQIASPLINVVNPFITIDILASTGYVTAPDGSRTSTYQSFTVSAQVQDLNADELRQMEGLNIQGNHKVVYLNGNWNGILRPDAKGGDLVRYNGREWLVTSVPEQWPDWTKLIVTLQVPIPEPTLQERTHGQRRITDARAPR